MACMHGSSEQLLTGSMETFGGASSRTQGGRVHVHVPGRACVEMATTTTGWSYSAGSGRGRVVRAAWMMYAHLAATVRIAAIGPNRGGGKRGQLTCKAPPRQ